MSENNSNIVKNATFIAALLAFIVSGVNIYLQYDYRQQDLKLAVDKEIIQQRKEALLQALEVIDNVYANSNFEKLPKPILHTWSIQKARDAMNKMIIFCADPQTTIDIFQRAIGLHNPQFESPKIYSAGGIQDFRVQVAKELNLPPVIFSDSTKTWISRLPGGE